MKTAILKISFIFLFLGLVGAGCEKKEELQWKISPDSETSIIQKEVDGVEFKFCLLNKEGEPATVFNEGENFIFQFSITNRSTKNLYNDNRFLGKNIFNVYNIENQNFGKPYEFIFLVKIGSGAMPLPIDSTYVLDVPWKDDRESWESLYYSFKGISKDMLPKGKYFTEFSHQFNFGSIKTDLLTFKINFEIK